MVEEENENENTKLNMSFKKIGTGHATAAAVMDWIRGVQTPASSRSKKP